MTPAMMLDAGLKAHRSGQIEAAVAAYSAVLDANADQPTARHLRGFALLQLGRSNDAVADLKEAVRLGPGNVNAWSHLAIGLDRVAGADAAQTAAQRAMLLAPAGRDPLDVLSRVDSLSKAALRWSLHVAADEAGIWNAAALTWADDRPALAIAALRRALCLVPGDPAPRLDLADLERRAHDPQSAHRSATLALVIRPNDPRSLAERAAAATELDQVDDALADTDRALALDPGHAIAWTNRAETRYRLGTYRAAVADGERARLAAPDDRRILANLGAYRLASGDLARGWPLFRHRLARRSEPKVALPRWRGEDGGKLWVRAEQGLGDELLFSTLWPDLSARLSSGRLSAVTVAVDPRLIPLAARALPEITWVSRFQDRNVIDGATHWCLAGDLAEILRPAASDFPGGRPGLIIDPEKADRWRRWLASVADGRPTIGFCWRSGRVDGHRRRHYPNIEDCAPLLELENRVFVALQYDKCDDEIARASLGAGSDFLTPPDLDRRDDQDGVGALMTALDGVVSADTAVLALAGALGVPAIGVCLHPGWVGLGQETHPWFPSVDRIYRPPDRRWTDVMMTAAAAALCFTGRPKC